MDLKERALLVREARFEIKRLSHAPRRGEDAVAFANRTSDGSDGGLAERADEWDQRRARRSPRARRMLAPAPGDGYVGYRGQGNRMRKPRR